MKFLFRSAAGNALPLARRVESEGHEVLFWISDPITKHVGDGLVNKTDDISSVSWADVIVFDSHEHGLSKEAELWGKTKAVVGSSALADRLECDWSLGLQVAKKLGISVPDYVILNGPRAFDKAREYMLSHEGDDSGWVLKPNVDGVRAHVSKHTEEMVRMLPFFERRFEEKKSLPDFILQYKPEGIEVSTEAWFNGSDFYVANSAIEERRLFNNDLGESTSCAGCVVWAYSHLDSPLVRRLLLPLREVLKDQYRGPISVDALVTKDGEPNFLGFTARFGHGAVYALAELVDDLALLLSQCANGQTITASARTDMFAVGLRASIPPVEGYPVFGFDPTVVDRHVSPRDLRVNREGEVETVSNSGVVFEFTQVGATMLEAAGKLYETVGQIYVPGMRYRVVVGATAKDGFEELVEYGLVSGPKKPFFFDEVFQRGSK